MPNNKPSDKSQTDRVKPAPKASIQTLEQEITQLRGREAALNKRAASLEKRNVRLEELNEIKDEFIGIASHQLRTPATGVKQYINLLLEGFADEPTPSQRVFLERAQESNDRQLRIIDDLLRVARIDSESFKLNKSQVDLGQTVNNIVDGLRPKAASKNQQIIYKAPKNKIFIDGDKERLEMALENILDNALVYSDLNTKIRVNIELSPDLAKVIIQDEGVGIDPEDFPRLFQKFSRIANPLSVEAGGSGLGLYWAHKVIKLHRGVIDVNSRIGEGATFTVCIPK